MNEAELHQTVRQMVRTEDPDRYLSALFAPKEARDDLFALYAFNAEIARIPEEVSEMPLAEIRLQWWRDALVVARAGEEKTGHPVADAFGETLRKHDIAPERLAPMIDARRVDAMEQIEPYSAGLIAFLDNTAGEVFTLAAEFLGAGKSQVELAARSAGRAYGLTGLARAVCAHVRRGGEGEQRAQAVAVSGASQALEEKPDPEMLGLIAEMRRQARTELRRARPAIRALPSDIQLAFQPLSLVAPYLNAMESRREGSRAGSGINPLYRLWRLASWRA
ncbi:squalene/phytoene synthase family protein [Methyloligella sp. 2.7D]|uniref:phytoene/squalene synthase family protein n=1 Tax=unclassified Methyloligella TaxID=2625955 RepID=UPI00157CE870|nr:squalene/phytoene synthase family protein [Methyloligella sp. GL2]QKP77725.1 squalene/phytoene synthase family protein [Methyloligella sp. GL2]